jgi:hypothetical protein
MKRPVKIIFASIFILFLGSFAFAQRDLEVDYPEMGGFSPESTTTVLPEYVKYVFNFSLGISGVVVFLILVYAGIRYLTSAGDPAKQGDSKKQIWAALLGLAVLFGSYLILTTINPQLINLDPPERQVFDVGELIIPDITPPEELSYSVIPVGGLLASLFDDERLERIEELSQEVRDVSEELATASQQLASLTSQCTCSRTSPSCAGECSGGYCSGDPCPVRGEIDQKRQEIEELLTDPEEGLMYWRGELEEEIESFRAVFNDLKEAEEMVKSCQGSLSEEGNTQTLLGYNALDEYQRYLEEFYEIKTFEENKPFEYISINNPFSFATFYCAESLDPTYVPIDDIIEIEIEEDIPLPEVECSDEIRSGEPIDDAEELAQMMLNELDNINSNTQLEITNAQNQVALSEPSVCTVSVCTTQCIWVQQTCCEPCPEEEDGDDGDGGDGGEASLLDRFLLGWLKVPVAYAQCCWDCSYCDILPCTGNVCPGDAPKNSQIAAALSQVRASYSQVDSSNERVNNYINEEGVADRLKISNFEDLLDENQYPLANCYNSVEKYLRLEAGESVSWEELNTCSFSREVGYEGTEDCYGGAGDRFDNFFCCYSEVSAVE